MSEQLSGILIVQSDTMGQIAIQPSVVTPELIEKSSLVIFPMRMNSQNRAAAVEWAATSQTPIFCHSEDIPSLVQEGFGTYRFHKLEGFKEIDFQGGAIDFFPAQRPKSKGFKSLFTELFERLGFLKSSSFHFSIRPKMENSVLFLTGKDFQETEWRVMTKGGFEKIYACGFAPISWGLESLSKYLGTTVEMAPNFVFTSNKVTQIIKPRNIDVEITDANQQKEVHGSAENQSWTKAGAF
jgi:hypothetical protein